MGKVHWKPSGENISTMLSVAECPSPNAAKLDDESFVSLDLFSCYDAVHQYPLPSCSLHASNSPSLLKEKDLNGKWCVRS